MRFQHVLLRKNDFHMFFFQGNLYKIVTFQHGLVRPPGSAVAPVTVAQDGEKHAERLEQNIEKH